MNAPTEARFIESHEYVLKGADGVKVGISPYAVSQLGDVVYVELPKVGTRLVKGKTFGVVESVKAVSDLYAPIDGEVIAINQLLADDPAVIGEDAYEKGWMMLVKPSDESQLAGADMMDPTQYAAFAAAH